MSTAADVKKALQALASEEKAAISQRFFKTGPGQYGEGDVFIGLTMPEQRKIAKEFVDLPQQETVKLVQSKVHEHRMTGLVILTYQYKRGDEKERKSIYDLYLKNTAHINNWDLIDVTTPRIVGEYLLDKKRDVLYKLAKGTMWEKRMAILATFTFIYYGESEDTLRLAEQYLSEKHDLMHKATGWMLREVGKRVSQEVEEAFLQKHYRDMPRTMLRYAIERFPEEKRQAYLKGRV